MNVSCRAAVRRWQVADNKMLIQAMAAVYKPMGWSVIDRITHQSFDWRTLILSKVILPELRTSALVSSPLEDENRSADRYS